MHAKMFKRKCMTGAVNENYLPNIFCANFQRIALKQDVRKKNRQPLCA